MANHKDLPSNEWHPAYPPGADVASDGDVFVSDGVGAGAWSSLNGIVDAEKAYAQISAIGKTKTLTQATDPTLNSDVDYINLTSLTMWTNDGSSAITVDAANGTFTATKSGVYQLNFWVDHAIDGTSNENIAFKFSKNGVLDAKKLISTSDFAGDIRNSSASGILFSVTAGDVLRIHVAATAAVTLTIYTSQFNMVRI